MIMSQSFGSDPILQRNLSHGEYIVNEGEIVAVELDEDERTKHFQSRSGSSTNLDLISSK